MKLNKLLFFILISLLVISYSGCGGGGGGSTSTPAVTLASIAVTPANPGILLETATTHTIHCNRNLFRQHYKGYNDFRDLEFLKYSGSNNQ